MSSHVLGVNCKTRGFNVEGACRVQEGCVHNVLHKLTWCRRSPMSTTWDASPAASSPPLRAMPTSAAARAGASFTPSPTCASRNQACLQLEDHQARSRRCVLCTVQPAVSSPPKSAITSRALCIVTDRAPDSGMQNHMLLTMATPQRSLLPPSPPPSCLFRASIASSLSRGDSPPRASDGSTPA
jgi:hypothetical protein